MNLQDFTLGEPVCHWVPDERLWMHNAKVGTYCPHHHWLASCFVLFSFSPCSKMHAPYTDQHSQRGIAAAPLPSCPTNN